MKVALTGATGFVGRVVAQKLTERGDSLVAFVRSVPSARERLPKGTSLVRWDGGELSAEAADALRGCHGLIHLAGEPIASGRWTEQRKKLLVDSRVLSTRSLVAAMRSFSEARPRVFICSSAVGFYGDRGDEVLDEASQPGTGFLADLCRSWEAEASEAEALGVRRVSLRTGMVLGAGGGALEKLLPIFRMGLGGPIGTGKQWISWIDREDLVFIIVGLLDESGGLSSLNGAVNAVGPKPVTNIEFSRELGRALHRPAWIKTPALALKALLGEASEIVLSSQRVHPRKLVDSGFRFRCETIADSMNRLLD